MAKNVLMFDMDQYSVSVGGLLLKIRKAPTGWEASVASGATILDEQTAKTMAEDFAAKISGTPVKDVEWQEAT